MQAVTKYGYAAATTKRLAKAAGIGEVTLFRRYGNKSQLVKQAMVDCLKDTNIAKLIPGNKNIMGSGKMLRSRLALRPRRGRPTARGDDDERAGDRPAPAP